MKILPVTAHIIAELIEGYRNSSITYDPKIESELVEISNQLYNLPDTYTITLKVELK